VFELALAFSLSSPVVASVQRLRAHTVRIKHGNWNKQNQKESFVVRVIISLNMM
jgi:hypothetical protein